MNDIRVASFAAEHRESAADQRAVGGENVLMLLLLAATPLLWWAAASLGSWRTQTQLAELERSLAVLCTGAAAALTLWWFLAIAATALWAWSLRRGDVTNARRVGRFAPASLRRLAAACMGMSVLMAPAAQAADAGMPFSTSATFHAMTASGAASPDSPGSTATPPSVTAPSSHDETPLSAAWVPRAAAPTAAFAPRQPRIVVDAPTHVVATGDCLWDIAATELGPDATVLEVDLRWRQWYRHNREAVGPDPHTLRAGTVLQAPPFDSEVPAAGVHSLR